MIGFQICKRTRKVDAGLVARFHGLPGANISDSMSRMTARGLPSTWIGSSSGVDV